MIGHALWMLRAALGVNPWKFSRTAVPDFLDPDKPPDRKVRCSKRPSDLRS